MSHRTEQRPQGITQTFCVEPGCPYEGKTAVQGKCFSSESEIVDLEKFERSEIQLESELADLRDGKSDEEYIRLLEAYYMTAALNLTLTLDECVQLRLKNRELGDTVMRFLVLLNRSWSEGGFAYDDLVEGEREVLSQRGHSILLDAMKKAGLPIA